MVDRHRAGRLLSASHATCLKAKTIPQAGLIFMGKFPAPANTVAAIRVL